MISFLFISFNRSELLSKAFSAIRPTALRTGLEIEFVVADDASTCEHQKVITNLGFNTVSIAKVNAGLGSNQNRGLANCIGEFIFQLQDDWVFVGQASDLTDAIQVLKSDPEIGIVQLTDVWSDLSTELRVTQGGVQYVVFKNDHVPWNRNCSLRPYSDCPHVKSSQFVAEIGSYLEGVTMGVTENDYKRRVANQLRWKVAKLHSQSSFIHIGAEHSHNPGGQRNRLILFLYKFPVLGDAIILIIKAIWRKLDHLTAIATSRLVPLFSIFGNSK